MAVDAAAPPLLYVLKILHQGKRECPTFVSNSAQWFQNCLYNWIELDIDDKNLIFHYLREKFGQVPEKQGHLPPWKNVVWLRMKSATQETLI